MSNYHHYAHLKEFAEGLGIGSKVRAGQLIGKVGNTGHSSAPHLHYEIMVKRPERWTQYVRGMTKDQVKSLYLDPMAFANKEKNWPMPFDHFGNKFLQKTSEGLYHPGIDFNMGSAWADLGERAVSTVDGIIEHMGKDGASSGWGNHIWIREVSKEDGIHEMEGALVQLTEPGHPESGSFALIKDGNKRVASTERAGLLALTAHALQSKYYPLSKKAWGEIPDGEKF